MTDINILNKESMKDKSNKLKHEGDTYDLEREFNNGVVIYTNDYACLICDNNNKILADISSDCSQNVGYIKYKDINN